MLLHLQGIVIYFNTQFAQWQHIDTYQFIIADKTRTLTWNAWFDQWQGSLQDSTNH